VYHEFQEYQGKQSLQHLRLVNASHCEWMSCTAAAWVEAGAVIISNQLTKQLTYTLVLLSILAALYQQGQPVTQLYVHR
jgi:hypothetical protein